MSNNKSYKHHNKMNYPILGFNILNEFDLLLIYSPNSLFQYHVHRI